jgi:hypothetical protein
MRTQLLFFSMCVLFANHTLVKGSKLPPVLSINTLSPNVTNKIVVA